MVSNKTVASQAPVKDFIAGIDDEQRRRDSKAMISMMRQITGHEPMLWGSSMVGFGSYHYRYDSGREGDFFLTGFSPRKSAFTVYIMPGFEAFAAPLKKLGPHRTGKSCLYLKNLDAIDQSVLEEIIRESVLQMRRKYEST